jgi:NAD(P)-dependent dehydrogenase (short-subunit alcohol dehydrogenase family)
MTARTALVTGGGSGIGRAVAHRLARGGTRVAILGRRRERLDAVADEIAAAGHERPLVVPARQEDARQVREAVAAVAGALGRIDILFNNAAIYRAGSACDAPVELWDETMAVNLRGPVLLAREVIPLQRRQGSGVIVNNASTLGLKPVPGVAAYAVSKAALIMLTRCLALEEAPHGIRALAICPGVVDTPIHEVPGGKNAAFLDEMGKLHPLGRVGTADEVAALVEFLVGPEASWMTGSVVTIDGGISI